MRFYTHVEVEFEVPDPVGAPQFQGDAPADYGQRAVAHLRDALERLISEGPATGYCILPPRRGVGCQCIAAELNSPLHGPDECAAEDPRAAACPPGTITVVSFGRADEGGR